MTIARWLVTGASGFLGRHLLEVLNRRAQSGVKIMVLGRRLPEDWPLDQFVRADLENLNEVTQAVSAARPEIVFHLGGRTPPAATPELYRANTLAMIHLLKAVRSLPHPARIVIAGSAAELGRVAVEDLPVSESYRCRPFDSYGLSKWFASTAALNASPPTEVVVARIFNPIGPGQPARQAFGRFAATLARSGSGPLRLAVGDLDARRDFIDARDVAEALVALALRGIPGRVYHVGAGESHRIGDGLRHLIARSGRAVELDHREGVRGPADSRADISRVRKETGWAPRISWEQSLDDLWSEAIAGDRRATKIAG